MNIFSYDTGFLRDAMVGTNRPAVISSFDLIMLSFELFIPLLDRPALGTPGLIASVVDKTESEYAIVKKEIAAISVERN